jgi:NADH-quinone oxidoreductase subunit M
MPLSILIWLPAACGVLGALIAGVMERSASARARSTSAAQGSTGTGEPVGAGRSADASAGGVTAPAARVPGALALLGTVAALGLAIGYIADYGGVGPKSRGLTHVTDVVWISELGIHYKLGIDGLNVMLIGLTTLLFAMATLAANLRMRSHPPDRPRLFYFHFMLAESAVLGAFLAQDLALFVAFFDLMLIPFYFMMGIWGNPPARGSREQRVGATIKLVIYTLVGSLLMLAAAIATGVLASEQNGASLTFVLSNLQTLPLSRGSQEWIFLFFAAAFLVKMPAFPLHGWMPDGYRTMPIEVLMVFSGVLSKVGAYGFLRIALPLYPQAAAHFQTLMLLIALASILYGSMVAFTQTDARLIVGFSSVAQMGFITLGIFSLNPQGAQGALLQMVNHGLVVAPLLFIVALLARRAGGSEDVRDMGGTAFRAPVLAALFLIVALATLAMPGSANFVGEFLILLGVFQAKLAIAIIAFAGVVMASVYALRLFIRAMHNRVGKSVESRDIGLLDRVVLVPVVAVIVFFAIYPQLALRRGEGSVKAAVASAQAAAAPVRTASRKPTFAQAMAYLESGRHGVTIGGEQSASEDGIGSAPPRGCAPRGRYTVCYRRSGAARTRP